MGQEIKSIAVLPFENISPNKDYDFFCDGITDEIINALGKISQLKVTSRTSSFFFKNKSFPLTQIGEELKVDSIVEGSVRIAGDALRISAQLVSAQDDHTIWAETWTRSTGDLFEIQDEVSLHIADQLREHFGHLDISDHLFEAPTESITAYEHYLKGKQLFYEWDPSTMHQAVSAFEKAVEIDPNMMDGHLGLADGYSFLAVAGLAPREEAWGKAIEALSKAKEINSDHSGLNYLLGHQAFFTQADYARAFAFAEKSLLAKPNNPDTHRFLSFLYGLKGDNQRSQEHIHFAKAIDPLNQETLFFEANHHYRSGNYDKAQVIIRDLLKTNTNNLPAIAVQSYLHIKSNNHEALKSFLSNIPEGMMAPDEILGLLALSKAYNGEEQPSELLQLESKKNQADAHHAHNYLFLIYAKLGHHDAAFEVLHNLHAHQSSILLLGFSDPLGDNIHNDARYLDFHKKIYATHAGSPKRESGSASHMTTAQSEHYKNLLVDYVVNEKPYLNPTVTLRLLANSIDLHPNKLSWLLNEYLNQNFNEFINSYRVEHFKSLVIDPSFDHISILGLAFESGFNSKTVFNTTFKKMVGMTPNQFKKQQG